jgi:adenylylsulfate kinase
MTSAFELSGAPSMAPILWITGLAGAGKSTLARAFVAAQRGRTPLLLDGDALRDALEGQDGPVDHGAETRRARAWRIARLARLAAEQGVPVVVATISLLHEVQDWNRTGRPPYAEVLLQADLAALALRKPAVYGVDATARDIVGIDIAAQYPQRPELVVEQTFDPTALPAQVAQLQQLWCLLERKGAAT